MIILHQIRFINLSFWRNPAAAFFTFIFPLVFLLGGIEISAHGRQMKLVAFYVPSIAVFGAINSCFTGLASSMVEARDSGTLKRLRGTPTPVAVYVAARIIHSTMIAMLVTAACLGFGGLLFGVEMDLASLKWFLLTILAGSAAFSAMGLAMVPLIPNSSAGAAILNATIFPLLMISNVFMPMDQAPGWLQLVSDIFPIRRFSDAAIRAFYVQPAITGEWLLDMAVMALWGIAAAFLAARLFAWQPRN